MSINLLKLNKKNIIKLFIFLSFIICWQSISTTFDDLIIKKNLSEINFFEIVNFIRHFLVYSIFPILLILNIYLFNKIQKKEIKFNFLILSLIFLYFLSLIETLSNASSLTKLVLGLILLKLNVKLKNH